MTVKGEQTDVVHILKGHFTNGCLCMHGSVMFVSKLFYNKKKDTNLAALFNLLCYMYSVYFNTVKFVPTLFALLNIIQQRDREI